MAPRIFVDAMKYLYVFNIKQHSITKLINFSIQSKQILVLKHKKQNGLGGVEASQTQIEHTSNVAKLINVPQRALRKCFKSILPSPPLPGPISEGLEIASHRRGIYNAINFHPRNREPYLLTAQMNCLARK